MNEHSLWGDLSLDEKIETPISILREQALALNKLTSGLLDGRVITGKTRNGNLVHGFTIVVPALGNYSVEILSLHHDIQLYPVRIDAMTEDGGWDVYSTADDGNELKEYIGNILQSKYIQKLVRALVAQARDSGVESSPD